MHIGLFLLINLVVASAICVMSYVNGHGAWGIALRGIGTLVALQAAYAIWIFAVAWIGARPGPARGGHGTAGLRQVPALRQRCPRTRQSDRA
jgi:hypothetical protein